MSPKAIQSALIAAGYSVGEARDDGVWGRDSIAGLKRFQIGRGLKATGVADTETLKALFPVTRSVIGSPEPVPPPVWLHEAGRLMGTREIPGAKSSAVIMGWAKRLGGWVANVFNNDDIPWCGLFVAHCVGLTLPDEKLPANPLSALAWGKFGVPIDKPRLGAIAVFKRPGGGHVGFYVGEDATAVRVRGGNQSNAVTETRISKARLVGYRWPSTVPLAGPGGPIAVAAKGKLSANEA